MIRTTVASARTEIRIDTESRIPKYQQVANSIIEDIEQGILRIGQRVPSLNEISEEYYLSRDTVEKAYNYLKKKRIIVSSRGKGYYVARNFSSSRLNVLFLLNKLSSYKLQIYNSFVSGLGKAANVDLTVYYCDPKIFLNSLNQNIGNYDHFVIMPHFRDAQLNHWSANAEVIEILKKLPENKLLLIDNIPEGLNGNIAAVYQEFETDIYEALQEGLERLRNYNKLILVFPKKTVYPYPSEILKGFQRFCGTFGFDFEVIDQVYNDMDLHHGDAYIIIEETDLVSLMKQVREKEMTLGRDLGIISYNDTPLKDLLGITVISTDFKVMGETAAYMIMKRTRITSMRCVTDSASWCKTKLSMSGR